MKHATRNRMLFIFGVLFVLGIASFVMLSPETGKYPDKQVKSNLPPNSQGDTPNLENNTSEIGTILPSASDAEINAYLDKLENTEITMDMLDTSAVKFAKELEEELELIAAGKHPDHTPIPRRENFSSDLDFDKAHLDFWKEKLLNGAPEYQESFESIIATIEEDIADQEAEIAEAQEEREEVLSWEAYQAWWKKEQAMLIDLVSREVGLESLPEADRDIFLKYVEPHIKPDGTLAMPDDVLESMIKEIAASDASGTPLFQGMSRPPVPIEQRSGSVSGLPAADPNLPVEIKQFMEQVGGWNEALIKEYPDIFAYPDTKSREAFSQKLPSEGARQYFRERQTALHKEYAALLQAQLKGMPKEKREQAIATTRKSLSQKWDTDFADSVIKQLQLDKK